MPEPKQPDQFASMSRTEFYASLDQLMSGPEAARTPVAVLMAYARKIDEDANFTNGLSDDERERLSAFADHMVAHCTLAASETLRQDIRDAWAAWKDYASRFGYTAGATFDILAPHSVFRAD